MGQRAVLNNNGYWWLLGTLYFNRGIPKFIVYLGHPLHSDSLWLGENHAGEGCSWSQPGNHNHSRTLQWQAQHWEQEGPPPVRSLPPSQNRWTGEGKKRADTSRVTFWYQDSHKAIFFKGEQQTLSYLYKIIAPVFTFRGQNERPSISIPPYTTPDISPRMTVSASPWHDKRCLNIQRICQSENTWVQLI